MPTATWDAKTIVDSLFGCCIGRSRRQYVSRHAVHSSGAGQSNEQTPLLDDSRGKSGNNGSTSAHGASKGRYADGNVGSSGNNKAILQAKEQQQQQEAKKFRRKKQAVDPVRLQAIRDQAQAAFFNVDSSQLLPSSTSLAQRQASMGSLQRLNKRDAEAPDSAVTSDGNARMTYTARQQKELIAASDQAERLYKAAMKTGPRQQRHLDDGDEQAVQQITNTDVDAGPSNAPMGLVRQIRLSVRDMSPAAYAYQQRSRSTPAHARQAKGVSPTRSRPVFTLRSDSTSSAAGSALLETAGAPATATTKHGMHKYPSVHSLRTLRLAIAPLSSESVQGTSAGAAGVAEDDELALMLGHSAQSGSTSDAADKQTQQSNDDDDRWEQRGRTRSRRGLVWMDSSAARSKSAGEDRLERDSSEQRQGSRLSVKEIWRTGDVDAASKKPAAGRGEQAFVQGGAGKVDEIRYGVRFDDPRSAAERRRTIRSQVEQASSVTLCEDWDEPCAAPVAAEAV